MAQGYRVLARKYRPQIFADLIGQEALTQTISNAIAQNKLANAYILTGIRGIGKTTSARIIARGLNCIGPDGNGSMTPNPCGVCQHCRDIAADCHVDVIEIDAASNTGVDNIREIIEASKYAPLSARYKLYIIDEVHMLSKSAFNALLKILEEPPEHLKFIFATTEIRKVPITILSRCQRFDLKRIDIDTLFAHLKKISDLEGITYEEEALKMIAKSADGSVRDSLSLLDQAIVYANGNITVKLVSDMIGHSDKTVLFDIYQSLMKGEIKPVLSKVQSLYDLGTEPKTLADDLLDLTHTLTLLKIDSDLSSSSFYNNSEITTLKKLSADLSMPTLSMVWQMLLKGISEIRSSSYPYKTFQMMLIRISYLSELPAISELISDSKKKIVNDEAPSPVLSQPVFLTLAHLVKALTDAGERIIAHHITNDVHPIRFEDGIFHYSVNPNYPSEITSKLSFFLQKATGKTWEIKISSSAGEKTIAEQKQEAQRNEKNNLLNDNNIREIIKLFPEAKIDSFNQNKGSKNEKE